MASSDSLNGDNKHHLPIQVSRSFCRIDSSSSDNYHPQTPRASSFQNFTTDFISGQTHLGDSSSPDWASHDEQEENLGGTNKLPDNFDELPIELKSLSDRFIDSLSAKVYPVTPPVDKLSGLFQDFYTVARNHINTHVATLSPFPNPQTSSTSSLPSISSTAKKLRAKATSTASLDRYKNGSEQENFDQQMLTPEEIADRKEARRMLEKRRLALEEAVERRVCEGTYDQIWRHRNTHDEAKDEKLRSRTAALSLVGIGLKELGVNTGGKENEDSDTMEQKEYEIKERLGDARKELFAMNDIKYPLGKLLHLKTAHQAIVDTLSHFHPSSSADEIMPMLIYTLITSRPEGINIISNLYFVQRFRNENKIDGEAAYCLTNLEAAISFLETVDLASLRADEMLSGPPKYTSTPNTPSVGIFDPLLNPLTPKTLISPAQSSSLTTNLPIAKPEPLPFTIQSAPLTRSRGISDLFQSSPSALGAASDAVLNTADQGLETIGNSLGDSYKFIIGKFKGRHDDGDGNRTETLDSKKIEGAQELVGTFQKDDNSSNNASPHSSPDIDKRQRAVSGAKVEDRLLYMISGRNLPPNKNLDNSPKVISTDDSTVRDLSPSPSLPSTNPALVESMRNLGNTLNPINRISGMGVMRAFGRVSSPSSPSIASLSITSAPKTSAAAADGAVDLNNVLPNSVPAVLQKEVTKVAPPIAKFMKLQNPGDMKLNEVMELLRDYRRLARALKDLGAV